MKKSEHSIQPGAFLVTFIFTINLFAGAGGKGTPKGQFENVFYNVVVDEFDENGFPQPVENEMFWGDYCGAIGMIDADYPDDRILLTHSSSSTGQQVELANLLNYADADCLESEEDLETCFPGIISLDNFTGFGTVSIRRDDDPATPGIEEVTILKQIASGNINSGFDKNGRELHYQLLIRAEPIDGGLWSPLALANPGEATSLVLKDWILETNKGNPSRGCQLCGSFEGQVIITVIRRDGPLAESECD